MKATATSQKRYETVLDVARRLKKQPEPQPEQHRTVLDVGLSVLAKQKSGQ